MRFLFEPDLPHQEAAIEATCDLFRGAEGGQGVFTIAPAAIADQLALAEKTLGQGNRCSLLPEDILDNLREVQERGGLELDASLDSTNFTVEMETGTGKTYVYLRTIFELNKRFGFTKFVIVVPSVPIREGVKKSIEQMSDHFRQIYDGAVFDSFVYDSGDLAKVRDFASASSIKVMIVTIQSINSANNVFYDPREQTQDIPAVEWVRQTNPFLIVDEPQSVDGGLKGAGRKALEAMQPLATLRYSATHVEKFHQVYRLDAFDAHDRGLVKSIEVDGAKIEDADNSPYLKLIDIETRAGQVPRARIELALQGAGEVRRDAVWVYQDDNLVDASKGRSVYTDMRVGEISAMGGVKTMQLMLPGEVKTLRTGESHADVDAMSLQRQMIHRAIKHHFDKEMKLRPMGIKVLSLFFVSRVADYRAYDEAGTAGPGPLATIFEEEYRKLAAHSDYTTLFAQTPTDPAAAHDGYFSMDKRRRFTEPSLNAEGELSNATSREDAARAFDLIMTHKEKLLDEKEPLRFIFSHSALREGWDNPNVFQICVLRAVGTERMRRQSIGRGLRLCVDKDGNRRRDKGLNVLTVVSDESYRAFADNLQKEMEKDLGIKLGMLEEGQFAGLVYPTSDGGSATLKFEESRAIFVGLTEAGMIEPNGKVNDRLRMALADGTVPLPADLPEPAAALVRARLTRLARKLSVRDANAKGQVQLNLAILDSHEFKALWQRISTKTTYRLKFDDATLVANAAKRIAKMAAPGVARVTFQRAEVHVERTGVSAEMTSTAVPRKLETAKLPVPDLLGELQNRTDLPRKVLVQILVQSGRVDEAAINPAAFLDTVAGLIRDAKREVQVDGIQYRQLDEQWYAQELFQPEGGLDEARMEAVLKAPLSHIVHDSFVERDLARALNSSEAIRVFAKLPKAFTITTPLGTYNPDWAIVRENEGRQTVYLVAESKGNANNLRDAEKAQIACGEAHFKALGVSFGTVRTLGDILAIR